MALPSCPQYFVLEQKWVECELRDVISSFVVIGLGSNYSKNAKPASLPRTHLADTDLLILQLTALPYL